MHPAKIQMELKLRGITQKDIAKKLGVVAMCVSREVNGQHCSERVRRAIAEAIGVDDPKAVFPDYYFGTKRRNRAG